MKKNKMTVDAARRIQSAADKSGSNQDTKARVMRAAATNAAASTGAQTSTTQGAKKK
jgi:hypothetical protein